MLRAVASTTACGSMLRHAPVVERAGPQLARAGTRRGRRGLPCPRRRDAGRGDVRSSLVGPKSAVTGTPDAAATCIAPESFDTTLVRMPKSATSVIRLGAARRIDNRRRAAAVVSVRARNLTRGRAIRTSTDQHRRHVQPVGERSRDGGHPIGRPAFRQAERRARRECDNWRSVPTQLTEQGCRSLAIRFGRTAIRPPSTPATLPARARVGDSTPPDA